jgi:hypothetical protein
MHFGLRSADDQREPFSLIEGAKRSKGRLVFERDAWEMAEHNFGSGQLRFQGRQQVGELGGAAHAGSPIADIWADWPTGLLI